MNILRITAQRSYHSLPELFKNPKLLGLGRRTVLSAEKFMYYGVQDIPISVRVETNNRCNRTCYYCPRPKNDKTILPEETFRSIIDQLAAVKFRGAFAPHGFNEPLTDQRITLFLKYARKNLPNAFIFCSTNGDCLKESTIEELTATGINELKITLHDPFPTDKLEELIGLQKKFPQITFVDMREGTRTIALNTRGGLVDLGKETISDYSRCCAEGLAIRANGSVVLCYADIQEQHILGNVKEEPIVDIWKHAKQFRKSIRKGNPIFEICLNCKYETT